MAGTAPFLLCVVHGQSHTPPQFILARVLISRNGKDRSGACCTIPKRRVARFSRAMSGTPAAETAALEDSRFARR
jgi:hypothetical protein